MSLRTPIVCAGALVALLAPILAGQSAIRENAGFRSQSVPRNDDGSSVLQPIGFTVNFFGRQRSHAFVNNNGNITFDSALATYTPFGLDRTQREIIAAFFADVDTRALQSALVTFGPDVIDGKKAFGVNYLNVGYFNAHADRLNSFQLILIDRSETGQGNFDIEFNYRQISWETGDASGGTGGLGGVPASVGWSNGSGQPGTSFELEGSFISGSFLDGARRSLVRTKMNSTQPGRFVFRARGGQVLPPLMITTGCPVPSADLGTAYTFRLSAVGGNQYRWAWAPDPGASLPAGLILQSNGTIVGTPTVAGTTDLTIRLTSLTDDGEQTLSKRCSLTVNPPTLNITSGCPLPPATAGVAYSRTLQVYGGRGPYRWSLAEYSAPLPAGLALSPAGTVSGVATQPGSSSVTFVVTSSPADGSSPAVKTCVINVAPALLDLTSSCALPAATVGVPYSQNLTVAGGSPPYSWSAVGTLPFGLMLNPNGKLEGVPSTGGGTRFTARVRDGLGNTREQTCSIQVDTPTLSIGTACPLPQAALGQPYSQNLRVSGGDGPYSWSTLDSLPVGISLSGDGELAGSPGAAGPAGFRLFVTDARGRAATKACTLMVTRSDYAITSCPLPEAVVGGSYSGSLRVEGGIAPYYYSTSSSLPVGLSLTSSGLVTGMPRQAGLFPMTVRVMDSHGKTLTQPCHLNVKPSGMEIGGAECPLPDSRVGVPYSQQFTVKGGAAPYVFRIDGELPAGLSITPGGLLQGSAVATGSSEFEVEAVDVTGRSVARACSLKAKLPEFPDLRISTLPLSVAPAVTGPSVTIELSRPYTLPVQGEILLTSEAQTGSDDLLLNRTDPAVRFTNGQRLVPFTMRPGTRQITTQIASTGTVAGVTTIAVGNLNVAGSPVYDLPSPRQYRLPKLAPTLTDACFVPAGTTGIRVNVTGLTTTREITNATLTYTAGQSGEKLISVGVAETAYDYFSSDEAVRTGGAFTLVLPFTTGSNEPANVAIELSNAAGSSAKKTVPRCR